MLIKIDFVDFWPGFNKEDNYFINILRDIYGVENVLVSRRPEYLFFSCFGFKHLKYDCVKIFYSGENIVPDFNICDYAIGMNELNFEDRYFRLPYYMLRTASCLESLNKNKKSDEFYLNRKFCSYVISNSLGAPEREKIIHLLNRYKRVDSGGKWNNNVGGSVKDKLSFTSGYKFTLCFENSSTCGYTTEKIVEGFAASGIPIYWGNPEIEKEFNPKTFVNCNHFRTFEDAVEHIIKIDQDDQLYLNMVKEPIYIPGEQKTYSDIFADFKQFIYHIFSENGLERKINTVYVGRKYVKRMRFFRVAFQTYRFGERSVGYIKNKLNSIFRAT